MANSRCETLGWHNMRRVISSLTIWIAVVLSLPTLAGQSVGPHVVLDRPCYAFFDTCSTDITIDGPISKADANAFRIILIGEAQRTGKQIRTFLNISSQGGDVEAAMQIGRDLRSTEGMLFYTGPCYSACVLIAAGAVMRVDLRPIDNYEQRFIGIHRPYFADSTAGSLAEADARYKKLMMDVRDYLREMNMPDELFQIMQSVGPAEMKELSYKDAERLGFLSDDPAFAESEIAAKARRYGLTSAEYRERQAKIDAVCKKAREDELQRHKAAKLVGKTSALDIDIGRRCIAEITDPVMWGLDRNGADSIIKTVWERCPLPETSSGKRQVPRDLNSGSAGSPAWDECVKSVGQIFKAGQLPALQVRRVPSEPLKPPPGHCFVGDC